MREKLLLLRAFFKKEWIILKRYSVNSLGGILTMYVIFLMLFAGYKGVSNLAGIEGDTTEGLVVGYALWVFLLITYQDISFTLRIESQEGTLEQLYMSPHGIGWVMGAKVAASFLFNLLIMAIILFITMLTSGVSLNLDFFSLLPVLVGTLFSSLAMGFLVGGLTLIFKRIDSYTQMIQFIWIAFISLPANQIFWMRLLPGSYGATLVRNITISNQNLIQIGLNQLLFLYIIGLLHLAIGYGIYKLCERKAMREGMLGHY